jgi:hypothetical protein
MEVPTPFRVAPWRLCVETSSPVSINQIDIRSFAPYSVSNEIDPPKCQLEQSSHKMLSQTRRVREMQDLLIKNGAILLCGLFYSSGLLVWPICALVWRRRKSRTRALPWVFFIELAGLLVLMGFCMFSHGILEHGYYWCVYMMFLNIAFTPFALGAALYDHAHRDIVPPTSSASPSSE